MALVLDRARSQTEEERRNEADLFGTRVINNATAQRDREEVQDRERLAMTARSNATVLKDSFATGGDNGPGFISMLLSGLGMRYDSETRGLVSDDTSYSYSPSASSPSMAATSRASAFPAGTGGGTSAFYQPENNGFLAGAWKSAGAAFRDVREDAGRLARRFAGASADFMSDVARAASTSTMPGMATYLFSKGLVESGGNTSARNGRSSATGLYQFLDQTWLGMVDRHGDEYGLGRYADAITRRADGTYVVRDPRLKQEILNLRYDGTLSTMMAKEFAEENMDYLKARGFRNLSATDMYIAHFLGASGAAQMLRGLQTKPSALCDNFFSADIIKANPFMRGKTLEQIYERFDRQMDTNAAAYTRIAASGPSLTLG